MTPGTARSEPPPIESRHALAEAWSAGVDDYVTTLAVSKDGTLAWDSEGRLLATGGDKNVCVWVFDGSGPEGKPPKALAGHQALCTALAFHPKRPRLASGADDMGVIIWEPQTKSTPVGFAFLEETVTCLAWTLGGRLLIGADAAGTVRAWRSE